METKQYIHISVILFLFINICFYLIYEYGALSMNWWKKLPTPKSTPKIDWGLEWSLVGVVFVLVIYLLYLLVPQVSKYVSAINLLTLLGIGLFCQLGLYSSKYIPDGFERTFLLPTTLLFPASFVYTLVGLLVCVILLLDAYWIAKGDKSWAINYLIWIIGCVLLYRSFQAYVPTFTGWNLVLFLFFFFVLFFYFVNPEGLASRYVGTSLFLVLFLLGYLAIQSQVPTGNSNILSLLAVLVGLGVVIGMFFYLASSKSTWVSYVITLIGLVLIYKLVQNTAATSPKLQYWLSKLFWLPCILVWIMDQFIKGLHLKETPLSQNLGFLIFLIVELVLVSFVMFVPLKLPQVVTTGILVQLPDSIYPLDSETLFSLLDYYQGGSALAETPIQNVTISSQLFLNASTKQNQRHYTIWKIGEEIQFVISADGQDARLIISGNELRLPRGCLRVQKEQEVQIQLKGGTLDFFVDNQLVYSFPNQLLNSPLFLQSLTIGQNHGLDGRVSGFKITHG